MNNQGSLLRLLFGLYIFVTACTSGGDTVTPESVGLSSDTLELADLKMQQYIDSGKLAGISTLILKEGEVVKKEFFGYANLKGQEPIEEQTIVRIFSMTKPVTTVALMTLFDEGKFQLDDKVSKYIPEFEKIKVHNSVDGAAILEEQNDEMTIRHLLTHTSGISYGRNPNSYVDSMYRANKVADWEQTLSQQIDKLSEMPLNFQPGTKWEYGLSIDVAGYLVEVLSGLPLDEFFETRIFDPLKMDDSGFYVPEEKHHRLSELYYLDSLGNLAGLVRPGWENAFKEPPKMLSGGGGLVSTLVDYAKFCTMLLNGGELDGVRILKESTVKLIMSDQLPPGAKFRDNSGHGLGGSVNLETGVYSWAGAASTKFWIDQRNNMIVITYAQLMPSDYTYANDYFENVRSALIN